MAALVLLGVLGTTAWGQSSSLYVQDEKPAPVAQPLVNGVPNRLSPAIARASLTAVRLPEARKYAIHDLVTIIVRLDVQSGADAKLDTKKSENLQGEVSAFPNFQLMDLLQARLKAGSGKDLPKVGVDSSNEFKGDAQYARKDTTTIRLGAEIIDVKPNGTLVLEGRLYNKADDESTNVVVTGTCRADDVTPDNTVLSTQLHDLSVIQEHTGELRKTSKKGIVTKVLDTIFNF